MKNAIVIMLALLIKIILQKVTFLYLKNYQYFYLINILKNKKDNSEIIIKNSANFKLKPQTKYLVLGHSHPECAFNDSLINNLKNLAQTGESYYYTYFKTIKVLEQNPSIEIVFVEFTNNQIYELMNNWIWGKMS